jgi:hypothetical protein
MDSKTNVFGVKIDPGRVLNTGFPTALRGKKERERERERDFFQGTELGGKKRDNKYICYYESFIEKNALKNK